MEVTIDPAVIGNFFRDHFGHTPLRERQEDILREAIELSRTTGRQSLKGEAGDLLCSLLALCHEEDFDVDSLISATKDKIESRKNQYRALGRKTKVALLGGAFSPPTKGHIAVAKLVLNCAREFDEVWLVPCNKHLYNKASLLAIEPSQRVEMCNMAASVDSRIKVFPYEVSHNLSGEWYHFIKLLLEDKEYENYNFSTIIGMDNANTFDKWINFEHLEKLQRFVVVARGRCQPESNWYLRPPHIFMQAEQELIDCSSTEVRELISTAWKQRWEDIPLRLTEIMDARVLSYIKEKSLYLPEAANGQNDSGN